jgi:predicted HAD superfamily Cof-like phosphohydrolase
MIVDIERGKAVTAEQKSRLLKELCDLQYVLSGAAVALGLNEMQVAFTRVHNSNLSKLGLDGKPIYRKDGKVIKGPNYAPPELRDLV